MPILVPISEGLGDRLAMMGAGSTITPPERKPYTVDIAISDGRVWVSGMKARTMMQLSVRGRRVLIPPYLLSLVQPLQLEHKGKVLPVSYEVRSESSDEVRRVYDGE